MQKWTKKYFKHFNIAWDESGWHDPIHCEWCGSISVDIHHIDGRYGEHANDIENLVALCRRCHEAAHNNEISKEELRQRHLSKI